MKTIVKHSIRNLIIILIHISGLTFLYRKKLAKQAPLVRVVCFHDVADREWFSSVLDLCVSNYRVITPKQFVEKDFRADKINILLTFDDGYQSWIDNCLPELEKRNCKALFFVNSGLLDCESGEEVAAFYQSNVLISPKKPLMWEGVRRLRDAGHTIGGHTVNHARLATLSSEEIQKEVQDDKQRHETMLDTKLAFFAYPFGTKTDYTKEAMDIVKSTGYLYQFSATTGFVRASDYQHIIPRTLLEKNHSLPSIKKWLPGGYDFFIRLKL